MVGKRAVQDTRVSLRRALVGVVVNVVVAGGSSGGGGGVDVVVNIVASGGGGGEGVRDEIVFFSFRSKLLFQLLFSCHKNAYVVQQ